MINELSLFEKLMCLIIPLIPFILYCLYYALRARAFIEHPFFEFYKAMIDTYRENESIKGDSWKRCSWAYLVDRLSVQFEDMQNDPDREEYFVNIGNYSAMIYCNEKRGVYETDL